MMRHRWAIPTALGAVCFILAFASAFFHKEGTVGRIDSMLQIDKTVTARSLELKKGQLYELKMAPVSVGLDQNYEVSATLTKGDNVVFEVADSYWHQRGTWREGGESGTWQEKNAATTFQFRVPETDRYDLTMALEWSNGPTSLPMRAGLFWQEPWFLSMWPLLFGGLFLFGFAGFTVWTASSEQAKYLMTVGRGAKIRVEGEEYEVVERSEHFELGLRVGVDLRLRHTESGQDRYLSVASWWEEYEFGEDEIETTRQQLYIGVHLTETEKMELAQTEPTSRTVRLRDNSFFYDSDNSGLGSMATERDGDIYRSDYFNFAFRSTGRIPRRPGEQWLECTEWTSADLDREWWLSRLLAGNQVVVTKHVDARMITAKEARESVIHDPLGVRKASNLDPFGLGASATGAGRDSDNEFIPPSRATNGQKNQNKDNHEFDAASAGKPPNDNHSDWN